MAAAEEERFRRIKHWAGFPSESIRYCLREANAGLRDVQYVAINQDASANLWRKAAYLISQRPDPRLVVARLRNKRKRAGVAGELDRCLPEEGFAGEVCHIEHHLSHLASAFLVSPFEEAVAVSVDGFGDFASAGWGVGKGGSVRVDDRVFFPHSLGIFYEAITRHLGFPSYGDEYKVMGLAPYGEPRYLNEMRKLVSTRASGKFELNLAYFSHHRGQAAYEWDNGAPVMAPVGSEALSELLGPPRLPTEEITQRHRDLARSGQAMYEEAFFNLLNRLHEKYRLDSIALAGGCAMNSVANGKVYNNTPFRRMYVQAAAGDAGGAIGAAFAAWYQQTGSKSRFHMDRASWGPESSDDDLAALIDRKQGVLAKESCSICKIGDEDELLRRTAHAISRGSVVGWFQGRMEWGPRALGNRSILADPRRGDMKDILNHKIKRRESFRPFAPSILRECVAEWFECEDDVPFMTQVYPVRKDKRARIPAVTHVDGTGRLQTVSRQANPRYHALIGMFAKLTEVPLVLNTSFNENEPIVCEPEQALDCFLRTKMDMLVLGDWILERRVAG